MLFPDGGSSIEQAAGKTTAGLILITDGGGNIEQTAGKTIAGSMLHFWTEVVALNEQQKKQLHAQCYSSIDRCPNVIFPDGGGIEQAAGKTVADSMLCFRTVVVV